MVIRNGFVTNSSSSSFVVVKVKSNVIKDIFEEFRDEIDEQLNDMCGNLFIEDNGTIEIYQDESYCDSPSDLKDVLNILIGILDYQYSYDTEYLEDDEELDSSKYSELIQKLIENKDIIIDSIEEAEVNLSEQGWQGDSDCRYYESWYQPKHLKSVLEEIRELKGYKTTEEVTNEDFCDYVGDKISVETVTSTYNKKTGKFRTKRTTELEG